MGKIITSLLLILFGFRINAQQTIDDELVKPPYDFSSTKEIPFLIATSIVGLSTAVVQISLEPELLSVDYVNSLNATDVNSFDRSAITNYSLTANTTSDYFLYGSALLPATFLLNKKMQDDIIPLALMTVEVFTINYGLTHLTKYTVGRNRPYTYNSSLDEEIRTNSDGKASFFSGHASHTAAISFMTAKVWSDYNPEMQWLPKLSLWTAAALYPGITGYLRVKAGKHFPTDVITGYVVGASIGWLIPHLHKRNQNMSLSAFQYGEAKGLSFTYLF